MRLCAAPGPGRSETWDDIDLYTELHDRGHAHSVECWQDDEMAGGLYGVSLGALFLRRGRMFSRRTHS